MAKAYLSLIKFMVNEGFAANCDYEQEYDDYAGPHEKYTDIKENLEAVEEAMLRFYKRGENGNWENTDTAYIVFDCDDYETVANSKGATIDKWWKEEMGMEF